MQTQVYSGQIYETNIANKADGGFRFVKNAISSPTPPTINSPLIVKVSNNGSEAATNTIALWQCFITFRPLGRKFASRNRLTHQQRYALV
jgi:hypothetical protein